MCVCVCVCARALVCMRVLVCVRVCVFAYLFVSIERHWHMKGLKDSDETGIPSVGLNLQPHTTSLVLLTPELRG